MATTLPSMKYQNNHRTVTGTITVKENDVVLNCDTSVGAVIINLLTIPDDYWSTQYKIYIVDSGNNAATNNITINAGTGQTIDNAATKVISTNGDRVVVSVSSNSSYITADAQKASINSLTEVVVYNTVYVMKNGSDSTGLVQRFDKPFLTIGAARTAALAYFTSRTQDARVRIVVESGNYAESISIDDFIDYDLGNSVISGIAGTPTIYAPQISYTATTNGVPNCVIYGSAIIYNSFANTASLETRGDNLYLVLNCNTLYGELYEAILMRTSNVLVIANTIAMNIPSDTLRQCINLATNNTFSQPPVLEIRNAKIFTLQSGSTNSVIEIYNGELGTNLQTSYCKITLVNCEVGSWSTARAAIECPNQSSGTSNSRGYCDLTLINTIIYSNAAYSSTRGCINDYYSVSDRGAIKVYSYGAYSNRNYSLTNPLSSMNVGNILIDSNVKFNNGVTI